MATGVSPAGLERRAAHAAVEPARVAVVAEARLVERLEVGASASIDLQTRSASSRSLGPDGGDAVERAPLLGSLRKSMARLNPSPTPAVTR